MFRPPEYAALINPMINAFAMRVMGPEVEAVMRKWCFLEEPEIGPRDWSPRTGKCLCKKHRKKKTAEA